MIDLWMEGYALNGDRGTATYLGTFEASTVQEAAKAWATTGSPLAKYLNTARTAVWGCRLFDNEADARRTFG